MKKIVLFFILATISESLSDEQGYCNLESCWGEPHTLCPYSPKNTCNYNILSRGLNPDEKRRVVNLHNELRQAVVRDSVVGNSIDAILPRAQYMKIMKWDDELERSAQAWADQCTFGHDKCKNTITDYVGQNVAINFTYKHEDTIDVESQVLMWYNEIYDFDPSILQRPFKLSDMSNSKGVVGHLTQFLWADTDKIGCGRLKYNLDAEKKAVYIVCNYAPGGNVEDKGNVIYQIRKSQPSRGQSKYEQERKAAEEKQKRKEQQRLAEEQKRVRQEQERRQKKEREEQERLRKQIERQQNPDKAERERQSKWEQNLKKWYEQESLRKQERKEFEKPVVLSDHMKGEQRRIQDGLYWLEQNEREYQERKEKEKRDRELLNKQIELEYQKLQEKNKQQLRSRSSVPSQTYSGQQQYVPQNYYSYNVQYY